MVDLISENDQAAPPARMPLWLEILRWIAFIPAAVLGSIAAYWIVYFGWWMTSSMHGNDSRLWYFMFEVFTNLALGAAFVYCGTFVAPRGRLPVAISFAGFALMISGVVGFLAIAQREWMMLIGAAAVSAGAILVAVSTAKGEIDYSRNPFSSN